MAASSAPSHSPFSDMCVASHAQEVEREKCTAQLECLNLKQKKFTALGREEETNCQTKDHSLAQPSIPDG